MLVRGMTVTAALFGFLEALIYVFGLAIIFSGDEQNPLAMIVYAVGFGLGILIGSAVEKKLAIGFSVFMVNLPDKNEELIQLLRSEGYGVTIFEGEGRDGQRFQLEILTKRNRENELFQLIEEKEPKAFIISYEPRKFKGGFMLKSIRKKENGEKSAH